MKSFSYQQLDSPAEIVARLDDRVRPYAGGTDLLTRMKLGLADLDCLIDIKRAPIPKGISQTDHGWSLGALTTLTQIQADMPAGSFAMLRDAASLAASPQIRNRATLGGNLLQRPRCWYYRAPEIRCWLKGGDNCPARSERNEQHALFGHGECLAVHPSDLASCLIALDANVILHGRSGQRAVDLADFFVLPAADRRRETVIAEDELLWSVEVPNPPTGASSTYLKAMNRKVWTFALVGVAALLAVREGKIVESRLALSGVAPIPWRLTAVEQMLHNKPADSDCFEQAAELAVRDATALSENAYKIDLVRSLIGRALQNLLEAQSN